MTRSDAYITVTCDKEGCHNFVEIHLTAIAGNGWDERDVEGQLAHQGWSKRDDGDDWCDGCTEDAGEEG